MIIKCCGFDEMAKQIIDNNFRIVMFGAGVIGTVTSPAILFEYKIAHRIECYVDSNPDLWNTQLSINKMSIDNEMNIDIRPVDYLKEVSCDNTVILLNVSRYSEVLKELNGIDNLKNVICYIMPMMCIHNFKNHNTNGAIKDYAQTQIPKVIHYMWLGKKTIPENLTKCIETWKKYCPDYEIIQWNESNYDVYKNTYMRESYEHGAYGFVPDYARLDILYNYGGIYLDTDVELIKSLDALLYEKAFCGVEKWQIINFGGCSGAVKGSEMIYEFMSNREHIHYINPDGTENRKTCGFYDTNTAIQQGYKLNGKVQKIKNLNIYTSDYFHPYDYMSGKTDITENTFSIHRFNGGWLSEEMKKANAEASRGFDELYLQSQK